MVITATGGGDRHALMVEHQLKPLFAFFTAQSAATAVYASTKDVTDGVLTSDAISQRIDCAVARPSAFLDHRQRADRGLLIGPEGHIESPWP